MIVDAPCDTLLSLSAGQIQTTGDGDPVLPLSGIASPELVQAIYASPLNLHFKVSQHGQGSTGSVRLGEQPVPSPASE